jgi:alkylated DNA nucleotide flippase Atl1
MASVVVTAYVASDTRRGRRTKAEMTALRGALFEIVREQRPMTVRQVFYRAVSRGVVAKTENEYNRTVGRLLKEMRLAGDLPWSWIVDNTRWMQQAPDIQQRRGCVARCR